MSERMDERLQAALAALESGESLDQALARYPEAADDLRPLLQTAARLRALPGSPRPGAQATSRQAFLAQARSMAAAPQPVSPVFRRLAFAIGALIIVLGVGAVPVAASASALPGEPLYGVKRAVEFAQLALALDRASRDMLEQRFQQERFNEIKALMSRPGGSGGALVDITGALESVAGNRWLVDGMLVRIDDSTRLDGALVDGAQARVQGRLEDGVLIASEITTLGGAAATATGTPTPTPGPTDTMTVTIPPPPATPTPAPTETAESVESETDEPEQTETQKPEDTETDEPDSTEIDETDEPSATDDGDGEDDGGDD